MVPLLPPFHTLNCSWLYCLYLNIKQTLYVEVEIGQTPVFLLYFKHSINLILGEF